MRDSDTAQSFERVAMAGCAGCAPAPARPDTTAGAVGLTPYGIQRGTTATFTVEGANIADADR